MDKTVIGVFSSQEQAERAVKELRNKGFDNEISIMAKGEEKEEEKEEETRTDRNSVMYGGAGAMSTGATTGGVLGGIAGLAIGAGALAIPGLGPVIAAGPIAGLLSGAATGGIAGGLVDWGIPEERGRYYEEKVKEGRIVATVRTSEDKIDSAAETLRTGGATDVETH